MPFQKSYWSVSIFGAGLAVHRLAVCTPPVPAHHHTTNISNSCTQNKDVLETMTKKHLMGREPTFINTLSAFLILKGTFKVRRHKQPIKHTLFSTNIQYPI
jgi:poly(A) polymerase Pap1